MAHEILETPYRFSPGIGGAIGLYSKDKKGACGSILHPDDQGRPLWFNSGMKKDKYDSGKGQETAKFEAYAISDSQSTVSYYDTSVNPWCLMPVDPAVNVKTFNDQEKKTIKYMIESWNQINRD
jgi:hypothetical protein